MTIHRLVWYVGAPLTMSGGGERLLLEGLRQFERLGLEAALFADGAPIDPGRLFNGCYAPRTLVTPRHQGPRRVLDRVPRVRHWLRAWEEAQAITAFRPDFLIANGERAAAALLRMKQMGHLRDVPFACFIHGSRYQFRTEREKYALVFRRHFHRILDADPVYRATVPVRAPRMAPWARLRLELDVWAQVRAVRRAALVFVQTEKNRAEVELLYCHRNVRVAHGAFPRSIFQHRRPADLRPGWGFSGRRVIFSLCRLEEKKRVDLIIRAFALLQARHPDVGLVVGGTGPERSRLGALARELGVAAGVVFPGFIPDAQLYDHYLSADSFTNADIADYDITTLVALALGRKAVVSSQHDLEPALAGLRQVFHAEPTPEGFAAAFEAALASGPPCDQATRVNLLQGYTWEAYFETVRGAMDESARPQAASR